MAKSRNVEIAPKVWKRADEIASEFVGRKARIELRNAICELVMSEVESAIEEVVKQIRESVA